MEWDDYDKAWAQKSAFDSCELDDQAEALRKKKNFAGMLDVWTGAIQKEPSYPMWPYCRGLAYKKYLKDFNKAIADFTASIELHAAGPQPNRAASAHLWRGECYKNTGRDDEARADFKAALRLRPSYAEDVLAKMNISDAWLNASGSAAKGGETCASCGEPLKPGAKFCVECGTKVEPKAASCSKCGAKIDGPAKFCRECGAKIG
jgi:tetratricopeptide (TPR) repeat protein